MRLFLIGLVLISGCITKVEVPSNLKVISIEHEGVSGKFVPDPIFKSMMIRYLEWEYYNSKHGGIR